MILAAQYWLLINKGVYFEIEVGHHSRFMLIFLMVIF